MHADRKRKDRQGEEKRTHESQNYATFVSLVSGVSVTRNPKARSDAT
jgi:hypothetical protein